MAPTKDVRPMEYEWVKNLYLEAKERNIEFYFHQSGAMFLKGMKEYTDYKGSYGSEHR